MKSLNSIKYLNNFYKFKIFIRKFGIKPASTIYLHQKFLLKMWGDEMAKARLCESYGGQARQTCPLVSGVRITG